MPTDFVAQLTTHGGPSPDLEVKSARERAQRHGHAWFPTRKPGTKWVPHTSRRSRALVFYRTGVPGAKRAASNAIAGFTADVLERQNDAPDDPELWELYDGRGPFGAWWRLANVCPLVVGASLDDISGYSLKNGLSAARSFSGSCAFAYWVFAAGAEPASSHRARPQSPRRVRVQRRPTAPPLPWSPPIAGDPLFGVDFCGAREHGRGNPKLWVAKWNPGTGQSVTLRCGSDPAAPFARRDLAVDIARTAGTWVLDFPFGIAGATAAVLKIRSWQEWLAWASAEYGGGYDPTQRRNAARASVDASGARWYAPRHTDVEIGTTWFPLFEQLYRQTLCGARDILNPLSASEKVAIMPFAAANSRGKRTVVVEGFPGAVIERRLGLSSRGYKRNSDAARAARGEIVRALCASPYLLPVDDETAARAIGDPEGDAVDALSLLLSAAEASRISAESWDEHLKRQQQHGRGFEGLIIL